jgi:hypothetical protein
MLAPYPCCISLTVCPNWKTLQPFFKP